MSEYDSYGSGDELFDDVNVESLVATTKRARAADDDDQQQTQQPDKRIKTQNTEDTEHNTIANEDIDDEVLGRLAKTALKENFGFEIFRHEQFAAIKSSLRGHNVLVVFPTGAGKSLCYQVSLHSIPAQT